MQDDSGALNSSQNIAKYCVNTMFTFGARAIYV